MKPIRLFVNDFMCYDRAFIDFTQFSSALIVGKTDNNDAESNGAGKTTIFKAIEYVLFNQADFNLEGIVRDDCDRCKITLDFLIGIDEYRLARTRTRKGATDLSLYKRTGAQGSTEEVSHDDNSDPLFDPKFWEDISGRRAMDTEKDLAKLIKINFKSFRVFVHFLQNDFTGLATATSEKRKAILKDALNLGVYSKLEKIAKDKFASLSKEAERFRALIEGLNDVGSSPEDLARQLEKAEQDIASGTKTLQALDKQSNDANQVLNTLSNDQANLEAKFSDLTTKEKSFDADRIRIESSVKEYSTKKSNIRSLATELVTELKQLEATQAQLLELDFSKIDVLSEQIISSREKMAQISLTIQNDMAEYEKLKIPLPPDGVCKHCRQELTAEHRKLCQADIDASQKLRLKNIQDCKTQLTALEKQKSQSAQQANTLTLSKQHLESLNTKIATKKNELAEKRIHHDDYVGLFKKFSDELLVKTAELEQVKKELNGSTYIDETRAMSIKIANQKRVISGIAGQIATANKELTHFSNSKAVIQHTLAQKKEIAQKKLDYAKLLKAIETKLYTYPSVLQAFSSTGIPNLIIHNILDDLQMEVNQLLNQFRPGLQLTFSIEKTKGDGTEADTLNIDYKVNNKARYYEQLSGAMKLIVNFSLKLGLSFLLQKMLGINIQFLLLDEIDQNFDKQRVDTFADIVKFLQKDFSILVITHNPALKHRFSSCVLVEQDANMISRAKVVSQW